MPHIAERLASLGYIVEIVSVRHQTGGYGSTRGIGDLLVWRESWATALGINGFKVNLEVKTSRRARLTQEQAVSLNLGGIVIVRNPDQAVRVMENYDHFIARKAATPERMSLGRLQRSRGSVGLLSFLPTEERKKRRTSTWLKRAREAARDDL